MPAEPTIRLVDVRDGETLVRIKVEGRVYDYYLRHGADKPLVPARRQRQVRRDR